MSNQNLANVNFATDSFYSVIINQLDGLVYSLNTEIVTANSTLANTTGNMQLIGSIGANSVFVTGTLSGGNVGNSNTLNVISDLVTNGSFINSTANVNFAGPFVLSNTATFSNTVTITGNLTNYGVSNLSNVNAGNILTGNLNVLENLSVEGLLSSNNITLTGNLTNYGLSNLTDVNSRNITSQGNILVEGLLSSNNITLTGNLTNYGLSNLTDVNSRNITSQGNILVEGLLSSNNATITNLTVSGNLSVTNDLLNLQFNNLTSNSLSSNNITLTGNLTNYGLSNLTDVNSRNITSQGNILVEGLLSSNNVSVGGLLYSNTVTITGNLTNYGVSNLSNVNAGNILTGNLNVLANLSSNNITLTGNLTNYGLSNLTDINARNISGQGNILVGGNLYAYSNVICNNQMTFISPRLQAYQETISNIGSSGYTTLNFNSLNNYNIILSGNTTFVFTANAVPGTLISATLFLQQDATGNRIVTWPSGTKWSLGNAPILSTGPNQIDVITFISRDSGNSFFGTYAMANVG